MKLADDQIRDLLLACRETHAEELDCDQFLDAMSAYVEARAAGRPFDAAFAAAEAHERLCANCREECAALREAILADLPS